MSKNSVFSIEIFCLLIYNEVDKISELHEEQRKDCFGLTVLKGDGFMRYEELVAKVKDAMKLATVSRQVGHVAYQFNVEGEAAGIFYLEIADGKVNVEPYEYFDRDIVIVTSADVIVQMLEGKLTPRAAYTNGQMQLYGDVRQLENLPMGCGCKCSCHAAGE